MIVQSYEEVFSKAHPGLIMHGLRNRDDLTQQELADKLGIVQTRVSEADCDRLDTLDSVVTRL